jgi:hypothetical protein
MGTPEQLAGARMTAEIEGDFAVFMTGMRVNNILKVHKWLPMYRAMKSVLTDLFTDQEASGALGAHAYFGNRGAMLIAYFRSIEHLERFANDNEQAHSRALRDYFRRMKDNTAVGIWHESYVVHDGEYESVYHNMPGPTGLAAATSCVPVQKRGNHAAARRATGARAAAARSAEPAAASPVGSAVVDEVFPELASTDATGATGTADPGATAPPPA